MFPIKEIGHAHPGAAAPPSGQLEFTFTSPTEEAAPPVQLTLDTARYTSTSRIQGATMSGPRGVAFLRWVRKRLRSRTPQSLRRLSYLTRP